MIKYLGSKRTLIPNILDITNGLGVRTVLDLFSGTARVGSAFKGAGFEVTSNDYNRYAAMIARCYVGADRDTWLTQATELIRDLQETEGVDHPFVSTYCEGSRYIQPFNGRKISAIREKISTMALDPMLEAIALTSLLEAADRVDSTCGIQMAFLKSWASRSFKPLELRVPILLPGHGQVFQRDAVDLISEVKADLVYLDPPYNQHSYLGNYHVWESLVAWDNSETYGIAQKRIECQTRKSSFNSKPKFGGSLRTLLEQANCKYLLISFSNEGYMKIADLLDLCRSVGSIIQVEEIGFKRYVGAQIGIYNPSGEKTGEISHLKNHEYLILVQK